MLVGMLLLNHYFFHVIKQDITRNQTYYRIIIMSLILKVCVYESGELKGGWTRKIPIQLQYIPSFCKLFVIQHPTCPTLRDNTSSVRWIFSTPPHQLAPIRSLVKLAGNIPQKATHDSAKQGKEGTTCKRHG